MLFHNRQCQPTSCGTSTERYHLPVPLTQHRQRLAMNAVFILALHRLGGRTVPAPADPTRHTTPMTCSKWRVAPQAGHQQWQQSQAKPPAPAVFIHYPTLTWMLCKVPFCICHAVVQHALSTRDAGNCIDPCSHTIWCILATPSGIFILWIQLLAVAAPILTGFVAIFFLITWLAR